MRNILQYRRNETQGKAYWDELFQAAMQRALATKDARAEYFQKYRGNTEIFLRRMGILSKNDIDREFPQ